MDYIDELVEKSIFIIREAGARFDNIGVLYSTGKDSTLLVHLIHLACPKSLIHEKFRFYFLDTREEYEEVYRFKDEISKRYNIDIISVSYDDLVASTIPSDTFNCCNLRKTETLKRLIKEKSLKAVITGIRRDEMYERNIERVFSPRKKGGNWEILREKLPEEGGDSCYEYLQDMELSGWGVYADDYGNECDHIRIHPILDWTEVDVWIYTDRANLPVNPLYFSSGGYRFRSLGCKPCTTPIKSNATDIKGIINELKINKEGERSGRSLDKEKIQRRLRQLGYL